MSADEQPRLGAVSLAWRGGLIALSMAALAGSYLLAAGALSPQRLAPQAFITALESNAGVHPGYRRNHATGVCVTGWFDSTGDAATYSRAQVFQRGRTPVVGRFGIAGGHPGDSGAHTPVRSFALEFRQADGEQWRTGMNNMPVFSVATPQDFLAQLRAGQPDPATGKPDPQRLAAFWKAHPESASFRQWAHDTTPSRSFVDQHYYGLDAFFLENGQGNRQAVRWDVEPLSPAVNGQGEIDLIGDLLQHVAAGPQRWRLWLTLGAPSDPTNDATQVWPSDRPRVDAGTVVLTRAAAQQDGPCRDINFDPTVLPDGIAVSDDPLLAARSAVYSVSHRLRSAEVGTSDHQE